MKDISEQLRTLGALELYPKFVPGILWTTHIHKLLVKIVDLPTFLGSNKYSISRRCCSLLERWNTAEVGSKTVKRLITNRANGSASALNRKPSSRNECRPYDCVFCFCRLPRLLQDQERCETTLHYKASYFRCLPTLSVPIGS